MNLLNSFSNFTRNFVRTVSAAIGKLWGQVGSTISTGNAVAMNAAGNRMVVGNIYGDNGVTLTTGSALVYYNNAGSWTQLGNAVYGENADDQFGFSVAINDAGDKIAIATPYNSNANGTSSGHVRIYSWNGTTWTQMGSDIDGEAAINNSGFSISMNAAGDRVAIGAIYNDGITGVGTESGHVRIYSWSGTAWTQLGTDINGEAANDHSGYSVSMNATGDRVVIGAKDNDGNGTSSGHVRIYSWNGAAWIKLGSDIDGEVYGDESGISVSINAVGDRVAIGAIFNDGSGVDAGHVRIYSWNGAAWIKLGQDIDGEVAGDNSGYGVSLNAVGDRVAIGARANRGVNNNFYQGQVRIYSWNGTSWIKLAQDIDGEATNDNFGGSVSMNNSGNTVSISAPSGNGNLGYVKVYSYTDNVVLSQLGADIDGEAGSDQSGWSVSMNATGDRVAISAKDNDGNGTSSGHVRIYSWNGTAWTQLGTDIDGEAANDYSGYSVSMNAVGDRVAIGAYGNDGNGTLSGHVRIYSWNGAAWIKLGSDIDGEAAGDNSGYSVSMNAVGDRVAIGAIFNGSFFLGHVRIYSWNGTTWTQMGSDIDGEATNDQSGWSVSMNAVGDRVAIGACGNDGNGTLSGHVRIYSWNGAAWIKLGSDIDGEAAGDNSGYSVSMNAVGDRVAIGAIFNDGSGVDAGHVRIYSWNGDAWTQLGTDIDGEAAGDQSGWSVSMNATGDRVAISAKDNDGNGSSSGHVRIYSWNGDAWTQLGTDIDGEAAGDYSGWSVSMNATGDRVAISAKDNDGNGTSSGHVRIYSLV